MSSVFEPRKIAAYSIVAILVGILAVQYVRALGPATREDRTSPCRAMGPQQFNPKLGKFPAHSVDFKTTDANGETVSLESMRGKVVFLNFWQTNCPPCVEEMPSMERLQQKLGPQGFRIVALASERSFDPINAFFMKHFKTNRPLMKVLLDPPEEDQNVGRISRRYGTEKWPETYLIDRRGVVRYYFINKRDWASPVAQQCIQSLLDE